MKKVLMALFLMSSFAVTIAVACETSEHKAKQSTAGTTSSGTPTAPTK
ncbi:MAG: hypothetical protein HY849_01245 [Nitrosomonadales bacterium]|nr:hypothetical protein [Nitrosomonadales bacterium]